MILILIKYYFDISCLTYTKDILYVYNVSLMFTLYPINITVCIRCISLRCSDLIQSVYMGRVRSIHRTHARERLFIIIACRECVSSMRNHSTVPT